MLSGVFGELWGCERSPWSWIVRGTPPPAGHMVASHGLAKAVGHTQMGVSGFWGRQALELAGGRHRVLGRMPCGDQAVPGVLSPVAGGA